MLSKLFLKGYQWPFDVRKVAGGSSIIDVLVYLERCKGRRVYLDYRRNPVGGAFSYDELEPEARDYLTRAGACFGTPVERLGHMNAPAVEFYRDKGVDLAREPLEISLCAQHNNGGLAIDCWWQTNVAGLFAVGEASASHARRSILPQSAAARRKRDSSRQRHRRWSRWARWRAAPCSRRAMCVHYGHRRPGA